MNINNISGMNVRCESTQSTNHHGNLNVGGNHLSVNLGVNSSPARLEFFKSSRAVIDERLSNLSYSEKYDVVKDKINRSVAGSLRFHQAQIMDNKNDDSAGPVKEDECSTKEQKKVIDKHFDLALQQYLDRRHSFAFKSAELHLNRSYEMELHEPHVYPGSYLSVRYMEDASEQKVTFQDGYVDKITLLDGSTTSPSNEDVVLFVRSNSINSIRNPQTYVTSREETFENGEEKRTQHSSFTRGSSVISAGTLVFDDNDRLTTVTADSGHYTPDEQSLYKFAEFGAQTGQFDPDKLTWKAYNESNDSDQDYLEIEMNPVNRMNAVLDWSARNPKTDVADVRSGKSADDASSIRRKYGDVEEFVPVKKHKAT